MSEDSTPSVSNSSSNSVPRQEYLKTSGIKEKQKRHQVIKQRTVSFHENVEVRFIELADEMSSSTIDSLGSLESDVPGKKHNRVESVEKINDDNHGYCVDDVESLPEVRSLDDLCNEILVNSQNVPKFVRVPSTSPSTSGETPSESTTSAIPTKNQQQEDFEEVDLAMRQHFPRYYELFKNHIITAAKGTDDYNRQMEEFKTAIMRNAKKHTDDYFQDLEKSLELFEKLQHFKRGKSKKGNLQR